jgi:putative transposase
MDLPQRKNIRLKEYDYSQNGAYFITICTLKKQKLLWKAIVGATSGRPPLSSTGKVIDKEINKIPTIYQNVEIVKYVIMPNHIHLIISIQRNEDGRPEVAPTISRIVKYFKGSISKQIGFSIWQKLFHDHIIRNKAEYLKIWEYIDTNPLKWQEDCYYSNSTL